MQIVLITGISSGIGKALTQKFLKEGYFVMGTSMDGEVDFTDNNLKIFQLDLSIPESILECVKKVKESGKKIDILINNAGALFDGEETSVIVSNLRKTLEVDLIGTIDFTERLLTLISEEGCIINISSAAGSLGNMQRRQEKEYLAEEAKKGISRSALHPHNYSTYKIAKCALNM